MRSRNAFAVTVVVALLAASPALADPFLAQLASAAEARTAHTVRYDGSYYAIPYPMGDVPEDVGVCTDVVIRAYRQVGVDLQQRVHEDMSSHFDAYPSRRIWGLERPDSNIDHRRVPNLQVYFRRWGERLAVSNHAGDYLAGDIVTWMLPGNLPHIGIVTGRKSPASSNPLVVHNIGAGPKTEDMLFSYPISGHYRYAPTLEGDL